MARVRWTTFALKAAKGIVLAVLFMVQSRGRASSNVVYTSILAWRQPATVEGCVSASSEVMLSEAVAEHPLDADSGAALRARQVQLLYDQSLTSLGGSLVAAVTLVLVFWGATSPHVLFSWLAVAVGITLARFFVTLSYRRSPAQVARANVWGGWFVVGTAASGLVWGA